MKNGPFSHPRFVVWLWSWLCLCCDVSVGDVTSKVAGIARLDTVVLLKEHDHDYQTVWISSFSLLVARCSLLVARCSLLVARCSLLVARCSLPS